MMKLTDILNLDMLQSARLIISDDILDADSKCITLRAHSKNGDYWTIDATISHGSRMSEEAT